MSSSDFFMLLMIEKNKTKQLALHLQKNKYHLQSKKPPLSQSIVFFSKTNKNKTLMQLQLLKENKQKVFFFLQDRTGKCKRKGIVFNTNFSDIYFPAAQLQQGHALLSRFSSNMGNHALLLFNFPGILSRQNRIIYNSTVNEK